MELAVYTAASVWALGILLMAARTLSRAYEFHRYLNQNSESAPAELQNAARHVASTLGLARVPELRMVPTPISPAVWSYIGAPNVIVPQDLMATTTPQERECILAHELTHIQRKDHLTRIVEWLATALYWWNPLVRFARNRLRQAEEILCDTQALHRLQLDPRTYAESLLNVTERATQCLPFSFQTSATDQPVETLNLRIENIMNSTNPTPQPKKSNYLIVPMALVVLAFGCRVMKAPEDESNAAPGLVVQTSAGPTTIRIGDKFTRSRKLLGEPHPDHTNGKMFEYRDLGFAVNINPENDDRIIALLAGAQLTSSSTNIFTGATTSGLKMGASVEDVFSAMGDDYETQEPRFMEVDRETMKKYYGGNLPEHFADAEFPMKIQTGDTNGITYPTRGLRFTFTDAGHLEHVMIRRPRKPETASN